MNCNELGIAWAVVAAALRPAPLLRVVQFSSSHADKPIRVSFSLFTEIRQGAVLRLTQ